MTDARPEMESAIPMSASLKPAATIDGRQRMGKDRGDRHEADRARRFSLANNRRERSKPAKRAESVSQSFDHSAVKTRRCSHPARR